jgi:hypothetical protein
MRSHILAFGTITLALCIGCGSEPAAKAEAEGKSAAKVEGAAKAGAEADAELGGEAEAEIEGEVAAAAAITPRIGGTIVAAGDYNVEVLAFVDGRVEAIVMDAEGELVADMQQLDLVATLAAEGEAKAEVDLAWDPPSARFVGAVEGGVQLTPGELHVEVGVDGDASMGTLAHLGLAVQAAHGGQVMVAGAYSVEVVAQAGFVQAWAFDVGGQAHAKGDLDLDMQVDGETELDLKWDPPSASYKAEFEGDLDLEAKPIVLKVEADGKAAMAAVASFHASANVAARGELDARAEVRPPSAKAKVEGKAGGRASAKGGAKVDAKKSSSASGKASAKSGGGKAKASASGKAKAGFHIGG